MAERKKKKNPRGVKQVRSLEETARELKKIKQRARMAGKTGRGVTEPTTISETSPKGKKSITITPTLFGPGFTTKRKKKKRAL